MFDWKCCLVFSIHVGPVYISTFTHTIKLLCRRCRLIFIFLLKARRKFQMQLLLLFYFINSEVRGDVWTRIFSTRFSLNDHQITCKTHSQIVRHSLSPCTDYANVLTIHQSPAQLPNSLISWLLQCTRSDMRTWDQYFDNINAIFRCRLSLKNCVFSLRPLLFNSRTIECLYFNLIKTDSQVVTKSDWKVLCTGVVARFRPLWKFK